MSITIPTAFVEQFSANVHMLAEQKMSRLRRAVRIEQVTGESFAVERLGSVVANEVLTRHGDTPLDSTPHTRRWGFMKDFDVADLIDKQDRVKLLIEPDSRYVMKHAGAMGRQMDDTIISALEDAAAEGKGIKAAVTSVALPAAQKIASGSTGMTVQKLIQAKELLDAAEVDEFIPRFFACQSRQLRDLLEDDKVTSSDFNTVKALVQGDINEFLGFTFLRTERLTLSTNDRFCYAWAQDGITLGMQNEPSSIAGERPDKRHAAQIYTWGSWGAVRNEDVQVVQVAADES